MKSRTQCPPVQVLNELVDGKLIEPELSSHAAHLEECEQCQNTVRTLFPSDSLVKTLRNDASEHETITGKISDDLIDALKRIPAMDSDAKLSADGLRRDAGLSLDELGLSFLSPPEEQDEIGRLGHYRVLQVLGRGGMGAVFLAEDPKLGRKVALKVMLPKIASIPAARDRFLREARAAASLKNDHIVTVYQVDEINGVPFLAMELLQGESLEDALRAGRRFSVSETIRIASDVARGLADAHEKGLVHRDIKPGNLWLEQIAEGSWRVKILDFGLARLEADDIHITEFGTIVGTPAFMAPEQARADRPVDAKADLFSLGCVLYVLCTGAIPFKAETTVGTLMALALNTPIAPNQQNESVPDELSRLTMQLLEKDPAKRPHTAREVARLLTEIEHSPGTISLTTLANGSQPDASAFRLTQRKSFGRGLKIATGVVIAALAYIAGEVLLWQTPYGKVVRIESNDPSIMLAIDGGELKVTGAYDRPVTLTPGKVDLKITKPQPDGTNFEFETDKLVIRKGDAIVLKIEVLDGEIRVMQDGKVFVDSKPLMASTEQYEVLLEAMKSANPGFDGTMIPRFENDQLVSLDFKTDNVVNINPLQELKHLLDLRMVGNSAPDSGISDLSPLQRLPLERLTISHNQRVTDLSPLKGMPLRELNCDGCPIADLAPLSGMQLIKLGLWTWNASDLAPLRGMPLTELNIGGNGREMDLTPLTGVPLKFLCLNSTKVADISALKGMPLTVLLCENTLVSDLSPIRSAKLTEFAGDTSRIVDVSVLRGMPITRFFCDVIGRREVELLSGCETLQIINYQPAAPVLLEFADDRDARTVSPAFTNTLGMEFVQIPKGKAWLTLKVGEEETSADNETVIEDDFFLGMYEVTQEEWVQVMDSNPSWFTRNADGADSVKILPDDVLKRLPVERVSWTDCQQFLKTLNKLDSTPGWVYRLPTEAEWQYACRGGSMNDSSEASLEFCTTARTNELTPDNANSQHPSGWNRPCRVGLFPPNPLGLYDMHGNVWEWCDDAAPWRDSPSRFIHGGGWNDPAAECRASHIKQPTEPWTYYDLGFRVARVPVEK
jgi:serine/threonine protein kinase/formylglycine-generating enzyme required for sulfatase activity